MQSHYLCPGNSIPLKSTWTINDLLFPGCLILPPSTSSPHQHGNRLTHCYYRKESLSYPRPPGHWLLPLVPFWFLFFCFLFFLAFKRHLLFLFYVQGCFDCIYFCVPCADSTWGVQKRMLGPLELELQTTVSHHMSAGNWTWILWRAASALNHWAIAPTPTSQTSTKTFYLCSFSNLWLPPPSLFRWVLAANNHVTKVKGHITAHLRPCQYLI